MKQGRVAKNAERNVAAQAIVPVSCRLLAAIEPELVPARFRSIHAKLGYTLEDASTYVSAVASIVDRFPRRLNADSETLDRVAESLDGDARLAAQVYVMAYLVDSPQGFRAWKRGANEDRVYLSLNHAIRLERKKETDVAAVTMDAIIGSLMRDELDDRLLYVCKIVDAPFCLDYANEFVLLSLAHCELGFVRDFRKCVKPFVRDDAALDRAQELARADPDLFLVALMSVPPRSPASKRFEEAVWGSGEPHEEALRIAFAFCSVWFSQSLEVFQTRWNLSHAEMKRMYELSNQRWSLKIHEATMPFGSRI